MEDSISGTCVPAMGKEGAKEAPWRNCEKGVWLESREKVFLLSLINKYLGGKENFEAM